MVEMVKVFKSGYCKSLEGFSKKGGSYLKVIKFPALWCLVKHSKEGYILFDTGYSDYVLSCTGKFPERLYSLLLPICLKKGENAVDYLAGIGIKPEDISYIIISHFHADHIGGLNYFKNCKFIYSKKAFNSIKDLSGISAVKKSFFKELIPADFQERSMYIEDIKKTFDSMLSPFTEYFDVFSDKSLLLVSLEGHAQGQVGLFVKTFNASYFFISDACWLTSNYKELKLPNKLLGFILDDKKAYIECIHKIKELHRLNPKIEIVPSHCMDTFERITDNV